MHPGGEKKTKETKKRKVFQRRFKPLNEPPKKVFQKKKKGKKSKPIKKGAPTIGKTLFSPRPSKTP